MKTRTLFATALTALSLSASFGAFAQSTDTTQYRYGLDLDCLLYTSRCV